MQYTIQDSNHLTKFITVTVTSEDYRAKVEKEIKNLCKNLELPGFRRGTVPENLIRRRFGASIISEEVSPLLQKGLKEALGEIGPTIGEELPTEDNALHFDINNLNKSYTYKFEAALKPNIDWSLLPQISLTQYIVLAPDSKVDELLPKFQAAYGHEISYTEGKVRENGTVKIVLTELNDDDTMLEYPISHTPNVYLKSLSEEARNHLLSHEIGDTYIVDDIWIALETEGINQRQQAIRYLGLEDPSVEEISPRFSFHIIEGTEVQNASIAEVIEKADNSDITDEASLRRTIAINISKAGNSKAQRLFYSHCRDAVLQTITFDLPEQFLIRLLYARSSTKEKQKGKLGQKVDYQSMVLAFQNQKDELRWGILRSAIQVEQKMSVSEKELDDAIWSEAEDLAIQQFGFFDKKIMRFVYDHIARDEYRVREYRQNILGHKSFKWLEDQMIINKQDIDPASLDLIYKEYVTELSSPTDTNAELDTTIATLSESTQES